MIMSVSNEYIYHLKHFICIIVIFLSLISFKVKFPIKRVQDPVKQRVSLPLYDLQRPPITLLLLYLKKMRAFCKNTATPGQSGIPVMIHYSQCKQTKYLHVSQLTYSNSYGILSIINNDVIPCIKKHIEIVFGFSQLHWYNYTICRFVKISFYCTMYVDSDLTF